jgi:hypothetical protein
MTGDICERARIAYSVGVDPLDYAEYELTTLIGVHLGLAEVCADLDIAVPEGSLTVGAMSRRIMGALLDAGWKAPKVTP